MPLGCETSEAVDGFLLKVLRKKNTCLTVVILMRV